MGGKSAACDRQKSGLEENVGLIAAGFAGVFIVTTYLVVNYVNDIIQLSKLAYNSALGRPMAMRVFGPDSKKLRDYEFVRI